MDTIATVSDTSWALAQPSDPAFDARGDIADPVISGLAAAVVIGAIMVRTARLKSTVPMWLARGALTIVLAIALGIAGVAANYWNYQYDLFAHKEIWFGQIGILTLAYGVVLLIEWAVGIFRRPV